MPLVGEFDPSTILWRPRDAASPELRAQVRQLTGAIGERELWRGKIFLLQLPAGADLRAALQRLNRSGLVRYAEPNFVAHACGVPNDPLFSLQWQMSQPSDADMDMVEAWDVATGSSAVILATVDTGFDYLHPDLVNKAWTNPDEVPGNGLDDDGNGWIDDIHGIDPKNGDSDPMDDNGHGTFVAGAAAAEPDNGQGIAGVAWHAQVLGCKFLDASGSGLLGDAITCIYYLVGEGAAVSNHSYATTSFSMSLYDAFDNAGDSGHLAICPGSNSAKNVEASPVYPACFDLPEILAITASDENDAIASFADFGKISIDCMVPGTNIQSTTLGGGYGAGSANSYAAPTATGLAALLAAAFGATDGQVIKEWILDSVDPFGAFSTKCATGGRINAWSAVRRASLSTLATELWTKDGPRASSKMGHAIALHPDADGDGRSDLALGVPSDKPGSEKCGSLIVVSSATGATLRTIAGPTQNGASLGWAVARLDDDVNGDAIDDLVVGIPDWNGGGFADVGGYRVVSGASGATLLEVLGTVAHARAGAALCAASDLDGDGGPDFVIGAPGESRVSSRRAVDGGLIWTVARAAADELGSAVADVGDQNGDGLDDFLVGLPGIATAHVLSGANGSTLRTLNYSTNDRVGATVASLGDVDGDHIEDFAVANDARTRTLRVVSGSSGALLYRINAPAGRAGQLCAIAPAPDRDRDKVQDFWVAWDGNDVAELRSGSTGTLLQSVTGAAGGSFGSALVGDLDLDGNQFADLVVGARVETAATGNAAGRVHALRCDPLHLSLMPSLLNEGDLCTARVEGGEVGAIWMLVVVEYDRTPLFDVLLVDLLDQFGSYEIADTIPTGASGSTFTLQAWSLKYPRPRLIASNRATITVQ